MKDARILLFGANGQVGRELAAAARGHDHLLVAADRQEADFGNSAAVQNKITEVNPDIVVNAAAYTQVDKAENHQQEAFQVNAFAPESLAIACSVKRIPLIHLSTDYVFDGEKSLPYTETDTPAPLNVYGRTKLAGEEAVRRVGGFHVILRTSWVYSRHGNNFVKTILRLASSRDEIRVVFDQFGCPTAAHELARCLLLVVDRLRKERSTDLCGTFHFTGGDSTNWFDFAKLIVASAQTWNEPKAIMKAIPSSEYPTSAVRPKNSRLDCTKIRSVYGIQQASLGESLHKVLTQLQLQKDPAI